MDDKNPQYDIICFLVVGNGVFRILSVLSGSTLMPSCVRITPRVEVSGRKSLSFQILMQKLWNCNREKTRL